MCTVGRENHETVFCPAINDIQFCHEIYNSKMTLFALLMSETVCNTLQLAGFALLPSRVFKSSTGIALG